MLVTLAGLLGYPRSHRHGERVLHLTGMTWAAVKAEVAGHTRPRVLLPQLTTAAAVPTTMHPERRRSPEVILHSRGAFIYYILLEKGGGVITFIYF